MTRRICSFPGCGGIHHAGGFCGVHYGRFKKWGDPAGGRSRNGEQQRFIETIAAAFDGDECLVWPFYRDDAGYGRSHRDGRTILAHRWVCELAHGTAPSPAHEAAHSCGNGQGGCVNPGHLRWATRLENAQDTVLHGTSLKGERHPMAKLSEDDVRSIKTRLANTKAADLAAEYGVSDGAIRLIRSGKNWPHVQPRTV